MGSIFEISLLSYFAYFAVLSSRKGKARMEVKKKQSFTYLFNERASAQIKVKVMKAATFRLIDAINREGIDNSQWGVLEDIISTKEQFGTDRDDQLHGKWLYIYLDTNNTYNYLYDNIISRKAQKSLKSIWYKTDQPGIYIVLTDI